VGIAGPLTNLLIAFVAYGAWVLSGQPPASLLGTVLQTTIMVNLGFFAFNILPIPPLDGSKIFAMLLPEKEANAYLSIGQFGIFILLFLLFFPIGPFSLNQLIFQLLEFSQHLLLP
jgi:Zn-dependent protease